LVKSKGTIILAIIALIIGVGGFGYFFVQQQLGILVSPASTLKAKAYKDNTLQGLSDNVWLQVTFSDESYDVGNGFNLATNTYVIPKTGYYQIYAGVYFMYVEDNQYYGVRVSSSSNAWLLYKGGGHESIPPL
jgi:hypothetical protein